MFGLKRKDKKQPKSRKRKIITWLIVLAILASAVLYIIHLLNKPAVGVIKQGSDSSDEVVAEVAPKTLESEYFRLTYPGRYKLQESSNSSESSDTWILIAHQAFGLGQASKIAIFVTNEAPGGIDEESAYKHAEAFPEFYGISSSVYANESVTVLQRTNPSFEKTHLWPHNGLVLTISLTSAERTEKLTAEIEEILRSVTWLR